MGKIREHTNPIMEKCFEPHKSGNSNEKIATPLKMPIYTVRAILQSSKATRTLTKLPGRGPILISPPCTARRMIREAKKSLRITVGELQRKTYLGHQVSKTIIRHHLHANKLFGRHGRKIHSLSFNHKCNCLEFAKRFLQRSWEPC